MNAHSSNYKTKSDRLYEFIRNNSVEFSMRSVGNDLALKSSPALNDFLREIDIGPASIERFQDSITKQPWLDIAFYGDRHRYDKIADVEMTHADGNGTPHVTSRASYGPNFALPDMGDYLQVKIAPKNGAIDALSAECGLVSATFKREGTAPKGQDPSWFAEMRWDDGTIAEYPGVRFDSTTLTPEILKIAIDKHDMGPLPEDFNPEPDDEMAP